MPETVAYCVESWRKYMPDYEYVLWNEDNFDLEGNQYAKEAYQAKKYAFVSDYVRLFALFHYGGHAIQIGDENYLIPVDADIPDERRAASRSVSLHEVTESMQGEVNIIVLDACRNNPLPAAARSSSRGLMPLKRQPKNSIIVYSAESGSVAQDGVFTPILAAKITESKPLTAILKEVRRQLNTGWKIHI